MGFLSNYGKLAAHCDKMGWEAGSKKKVFARYNKINFGEYEKGSLPPFEDFMMQAAITYILQERKIGFVMNKAFSLRIMIREFEREEKDTLVRLDTMTAIQGKPSEIFRVFTPQKPDELNDGIERLRQFAENAVDEKRAPSSRHLRGL